MNLSLSSDQELLRSSIREFAETELRPHVMEWDEAQTFPLEVIHKLGELGYLGSIFPEELGGAGLGYRVHAHLDAALTLGVVSFPGLEVSEKTAFVIGLGMRAF